MTNFFFNKRQVLPFLVFSCSFGVFAQNTETPQEVLKLDLEIRPRAEYKNHYKLAPFDNFDEELYVSQRNRLGVTYQRKNFKFFTALQEIHLWGKSGIASEIGSINAYEMYIEPTIAKNLSVRIGRQGITIDNGRIFSDAPWGQQGRSHEGIRFFYKNPAFTSDFTTAFTRNYGKRFDVAYSPVAAQTYKLLLIHQLKYQFNKHFTISTLNSSDVFEKPTEPNAYYSRITNGGRLEYFQGDYYFTINAHYQYGRAANQKKIRAYYLQPEVSYTKNKTKIRLGAEILSGEDISQTNTYYRSFVPLYGVAWKFMGNMNFFTRFPADVGNSGLLNPYIFAFYTVNKKLTLRADGNLFYSSHNLLDSKKQKANRYLGFESDLSFNYKPNKFFDINFGFSFLQATESMVLLKKMNNANQTPLWSYLNISFKPQTLILYQKNKT